MLILSTVDCHITIQKIKETQREIVIFNNTEEFLAVASGPANPAKLNPVYALNCADNVTGVYGLIDELHKKLILVTTNAGELKDKQDDCKISSDLAKIATDTISWLDLTFSVRHQIVYEIEKAIGESWHGPILEALKAIQGQTLVDLIQGKYPPLFKNTLPDQSKYYVPRRLVTRNVLADNIFKRQSKDIFFFMGIERCQLSALLHDTRNQGQCNNNSSHRFQVLEDPCHFDEICYKLS